MFSIVSKLNLALAFLSFSSASCDYPECLSLFLRGSPAGTWENNHVFPQRLVTGPSLFSHRFSRELDFVSPPSGCCPWAVFPWVLGSTFLVPGLDSMRDSSCGWASTVLIRAGWSQWKGHKLGHQTQLDSESSSATCELCGPCVIF